MVEGSFGKEHLLEQVVQNAKDGIMITTADDINNGPHILYVNDAFTSISGYKPKEIIGKTPRILQGENTCRETLNELRSCLEAGMPFQGELINYSKTGREYWLEVSIVPIKDNLGKVTHFAAIERDVTTRKEEELFLIQAKERAEENTKAKSEFLANMSHELRTPMNGILGVSQLLMDSRVDEEQLELIRTVYSSGENLLQLLNDILDISKVEAGDLQLEEVPFDLSILLQETLQLYAPVAQQKQLKLELSIQENIPHLVVGDPARLQQILRNLISNALKFTEEGCVTIKAAISNQTGSPEIYFQVQDTGIGVPEDKLDAIFDKFTQADTTTTRKYGGTGLGLAITRELVQMMHGRLGVESTQGYGSVFYFSTPVREAEEGAKAINIYSEGGDKMECNPSKLKILAVDDHPINILFIQKLLKKIGVKHVDIAANGVEALYQIEANEYDLVFMDCQMPELDGYEATKIIREQEVDSGEHLKIVAMTANAMVGDREKCLKAGMDEYISKPMKMERIREVMNELVPDEESSSIDIAQEIMMHTSKHAPQTSGATPIDMEHLEMFTDGDPEEEKVIFEMFIEQGQIIVSELEVGMGDDELWRKAAHKLKGAAGNLGAVDLADGAKKAETGHEESLEDKQETLNEINSKFAEVCSFINSRMIA